MNEALQLMNTKLQLNNLNIQFDPFLSQLQNGLIINIGMQIEEISLKLLNLGLEMLNIEIQSNNITFFNSTQQIKNIGDMIQNIALQMTNMNSMKMSNFNMAIPLPNLMINNNFSDNIPKVDVTFNESGLRPTISFKYGTTIKEMIEIFLKKIGVAISDENQRFIFLYNGTKINQSDLTSIEIFFKESKHPVVVVIDPKNVMGG